MGTREGQAQPCHAGCWPWGEEEEGQEEGNWRLGWLGDEASRPNEGGRATRWLRWGDRSRGALSTVRPQLMPGGLPIPSLGTTWGGWIPGHSGEGMIIPLPLHSLVGSGAGGGGAFGWLALGWGKGRGPGESRKRWAFSGSRQRSGS